MHAIGHAHPQRRVSQGPAGRLNSKAIDGQRAVASRLEAVAILVVNVDKPRELRGSDLPGLEFNNELITRRDFKLVFVYFGRLLNTSVDRNRSLYRFGDGLSYFGIVTYSKGKGQRRRIGQADENQWRFRAAQVRCHGMAGQRDLHCSSAPAAER